METVHILSLDIYNANLRHCKMYQDKIVDCFDSGKLKSLWDIIKEEYFLKNDPALESICTGCPLNIYLVQQGCQGEIYNLNLLINFLKIHFPEAILLKQDLTNAKLSFEEVLRIKQELDDINIASKKIKWPTACVYFQGNPVVMPAKDEKKEWFFYPWLGAPEKHFVRGNEAYRFCVAPEGIIMQKSYVEIPHIFKHLWKKEGKTFGKTIKDEVVVFEEELSLHPAWDMVDEEREGELIFKELGADTVMRYLFDTLNAFFVIAVKNRIGLSVSEVQ